MGQNQKQENSFYLWTNKNGFYENLIKSQDFLIPSEYEELRAR